MPVFLFALFALFLTAPPAAAQQACTEMWCQEGLTLNLNGSDWPAGRYTFTVSLDGATTHCTGSLPFKSCEGNVTCDTQDVTIGESGCALPVGHSFHAIMSQKTPQHLNVAITRADGKTFSFDSAVEKKCFYPNGEGCDPRPCCSAVLQADVAWE